VGQTRNVPPAGDGVRTARNIGIRFGD